MSNYDIAYVFKAIDDFSPALKKINEAMSNFEKQTEKAEKKFKKFSATVEKTGKFLFTKLALPLAAAAIYAVKNSEQFRKMEIGLIGVAGSAANAAKIMSQVKQMSMATGLAPEGLTETARGLKAAGYSMDELGGKLKQMAMFAVVSGKDINEISSSFIRMRSLGYTSARLLGKMAKDGIPLVKAFKEYYNLSDKAWNKLASKKIDFKLMEPVLASMTKNGSSFSEAYRKMLMTTGTSAERIHNIMRIMAADFGDSLNNVFGIDSHMKGIADSLMRAEPKLKAWLDANPELIQTGTILGGIFIALTGVASVIKTIASFSGPVLAVMAIFEGMKGVNFKPLLKSIATAALLAPKHPLEAMKELKGGLETFGGQVENVQGGKLQSALDFVAPPSMKIDLNTTAPDYITLRGENGSPKGAIQLATSAALGNNAGYR
jgi:hypothetical protein